MSLQHNQSKHRQPSSAARQSVHDAFDPTQLAEMCVMTDFSQYAERVDLTPSANGRPRFYWYQDNGSDILAVAHLDSVQDDGTCSVTKTSAGYLATSGALDDRLGVYVLLGLLPKLGITCDWLLTTDEEICQSTAADFPADKDYNWIIQFDRGGTDVVMYQYETPFLVSLVEDCGARVGVGSFSDICLLDHLQCAGFNWGVGYQDYHSPRSHAWLDDTFRMVARFIKFYNVNAGKAFIYHEPERITRGRALAQDSDDSEDWGFEYDADGNLIGGDTKNEYDLGYLVADCGHEVDLDDNKSYVKDQNFILCRECGRYDQ